MTTVYTVNNKVLKNSATDKWLKKPDATAGFVMNASNATYTQISGAAYWISWEGPNYPDGYNGNGKQYILVNNNTEIPSYKNGLTYASGPIQPGPYAINADDMYVQGTSTGTLLNNRAGGSYGTYIVWPAPISSYSLEEVQAYMANVTITILDP